jgi:hypothetical protein
MESKDKTLTDKQIKFIDLYFKYADDGEIKTYLKQVLGL